MAITSASVQRVDPRQEAFGEAMKALKDLQQVNQQRQAIRVERERIKESQRQFNAARQIELMDKAFQNTIGGMRGFLETQEGREAMTATFSGLMDSGQAAQLTDALASGAMDMKSLVEFAASVRALDPDAPDIESEYDRLRNKLQDDIDRFTSAQQAQMEAAMDNPDPTAQVDAATGGIFSLTNSAVGPVATADPGAGPNVDPNTPEAAIAGDTAGTGTGRIPEVDARGEPGAVTVPDATAAPAPAAAEPRQRVPSSTGGPVTGDARTGQVRRPTTDVSRTPGLQRLLEQSPAKSADPTGLNDIAEEFSVQFNLGARREYTPAVMAAVMDPTTLATISTPELIADSVEGARLAVQQSRIYEEANRTQRQAMERRAAMNHARLARFADQNPNDALREGRTLSAQEQGLVAELKRNKPVVTFDMLRQDPNTFLRNVENQSPRVREIIFGSSQERITEMAQQGASERQLLQLDQQARQYWAANDLARDEFDFNTAMELLKLRIGWSTAHAMETADPFMLEVIKVGGDAMTWMLEDEKIWADMLSNDAASVNRGEMAYEILRTFFQHAGGWELVSFDKFREQRDTGPLRMLLNQVSGGRLGRPRGQGLTTVDRSDPTQADTPFDPILRFQQLQALQNAANSTSQVRANVPDPRILTGAGQQQTTVDPNEFLSGAGLIN